MIGVEKYLNSLLASEPCFNLNVQYFSIDIDIVINIQYNNLMFSITLTRNADNVCLLYIWCQCGRCSVIKFNLISKRDSYHNFLSIIGGNVKNNTGVCLEKNNTEKLCLENKLEVNWNVMFCEPKGSLGRVNVLNYQSANGSLAVLELITSGIVMALSTCSSLENSEAAGGVRGSNSESNLLTGNDRLFFCIPSIKPGLTPFLDDSWEKCRHETESFFFSREVPQVQTPELVLGHGRENIFLGGSSDISLRLLLLNDERRGELLTPNSLHRSSIFSDWNTGTGSICKLNLVRIMLSPIRLTCEIDVRMKSCKDAKNSDLSRSVASMWSLTLLRSEVNDAILTHIDVTIIVGGEDAIHRRGSVSFKRLSWNLFDYFKCMIEGNWGRVCILWKFPFVINGAVRELYLAINPYFRHDANPSFPTARPPVLTNRLCDAVSDFVGALTFITTTTVTEAATLPRLRQKSAIRISRQKFRGLFAKCCEISGIEKSKDVGNITFIKEEISDHNTPDDTNYILTNAVID